MKRDIIPGHTWFPKTYPAPGATPATFRVGQVVRLIAEQRGSRGDEEPMVVLRSLDRRGHYSAVSLGGGGMGCAIDSYREPLTDAEAIAALRDASPEAKRVLREHGICDGCSYQFGDLSGHVCAASRAIVAPDYVPEQKPPAREPKRCGRRHPPTPPCPEGLDPDGWAAVVAYFGTRVADWSLVAALIRSGPRESSESVCAYYAAVEAKAKQSAPVSGFAIGRRVRHSLVGEGKITDGPRVAKGCKTVAEWWVTTESNSYWLYESRLTLIDDAPATPPPDPLACPADLDPHGWQCALAAWSDGYQGKRPSPTEAKMLAWEIRNHTSMFCVRAYYRALEPYEPVRRQRGAVVYCDAGEEYEGWS